MRQRPRYLLDTEVLVRAFRSDGPARELLQRGMLRDLSLLTSVTILDELEDVLARPKFGFKRADLHAVRHVLLRAADVVVLMSEDECARWVPSDPPFEVGTDAEACGAYRRSVPYGVTQLMTSEEREHQAKELDARRTPGTGSRAGADEVVRELTADLSYDAVGNGIRAAVLTPVEIAKLSAELVSACGARLALDLRHVGSFDFLSGTRFDVPNAAPPVALDLVWYSSDRAQTQALRNPDLPTIADFGFSDDNRSRSVLAGGLVLILDAEGPEGEPDIRLVVPVDEPLAETPAIRTDHRISGCHAGRVAVTSRDPAGFTSYMTAWWLGGPSGLLAGSNLSPDAVVVSFLLADRIARSAGLPIPPPEALEPLVPPRHHDLIVRP